MWAPSEPNKSLLPGRYTSADPYKLTAMLDDSPLSDIDITVDMVVHTPVEVNLASEFVGAALSASGSSMYFTVQDAAMGPDQGIWWGSSDATRLTVPMRDESSLQVVDVALDAVKRACGSDWELNAAQAAWDCSHAPVLALTANGNEQLQSGHSYRSVDSAPLVLHGRRWHSPNAKQVVDTLAYSFVYLAP